MSASPRMGRRVAYPLGDRAIDARHATGPRPVGAEDPVAVEGVQGLAGDRKLQEYAWSQNVLLVGPNTLLFVVNQRTTPGVSWFPFPLGGWALGLSIHGLAVYFSLSGLRERLVESELRKLESRSN